MVLKKLQDKNIILASKSPRRYELLKSLDIKFETKIIENIDENFPNSIPIKNIAVYLAKQKAKAYVKQIDKNTIIITADTIVKYKKEVLNKPKDKTEAIKMLKKLSGKKHKVITGVCINTFNKQICFKSVTTVYFNKLSKSEIEYYIDKYKPFDKAGSYGIQEWIGFIAIKKIKGSYYNVMGLPVQKLYNKLQKI